MDMKTDKRAEQQGKKTYGAPRLVSYGSLQRLTQQVKGANNSDGDVGPKSRSVGAA